MLWANTVAWGACLFSTLLPIRVAQKFLDHNPRLFTSLALFSLVWALLLPYYGSINSSELFGGFGGFLLVYVGGILRREAKEKFSHFANEVSETDRFSLWLLPLVIAPSALSLNTPEGNIQLLSINYVELVWSTLMTIIGLAAIYSGANLLFLKRQSQTILVIVVCYCALEVVFVVNFIFTDPHGGSNGTPMQEQFKYLFAGAKVVFASAISYMIFDIGSKEADRKLPLRIILRKLIGA